jgi:biofilm PGA synthesis N-glycosyltransferase PgaC
MKWVFWASVAMVVYTYLGYPGWLWLRAKLRPRPVKRSSYFPSVSVAMVVRNEEKVLPHKLKNLMALDYPAELEVVVVSDGSTDSTEDILKHYSQDPRIHAFLSAQARGKAACLNDAIRACSGEIVLFTDARQQIESNALRILAENFADSTVGCASGELMLGDPVTGEAGQGMGLYWRIEKTIRDLESDSGSVAGATGAIYAARRELLVPLPSETLLDDVYLPMHVVKQGFRVVFDGRARAWDDPNLGGRREFSRKVRTLSGNYQLLQLAPWLLSRTNPIRFEFVSHKLLRLLMPLALFGVLLSSILCQGAVYKLAMWAQIGFYLLGALALSRLSLGPLSRIADAASTFMVLNAAAAMAFTNFVTGRRAVWIPISIPSDGSRREAQS